MHSNDYVKAYKLAETYRFDRTSFVRDLMVDFDALLASAGDMSYDRFQAVVTDLRIKWDNIFNGSKVSPEHSDKFWGFVYASEIVPRRDRLVPRPKRTDRVVERA